MEITEKTVIGQLVAEDYRAAEVFAKFGIDFCCKGNLTIGQVCEKKQIDSLSLVEQLMSKTSEKDHESADMQAWPLDLLADYIEKRHHRYVVEKTPAIQQYLAKVTQVHGKVHPELFDIQAEFNQCASALAAHMKREELILFPYIRKLAMARENEILVPHFGTVRNPIAMMREEHDEEGERFRRISVHTNSYTPPTDACNTYRVTYALLAEFEKDLHRHVHLENNILFPKAIELELTQSGGSCVIS